jgi:hypothetical protein
MGKHNPARSPCGFAAEDPSGTTRLNGGLSKVVSEELEKRMRAEVEDVIASRLSALQSEIARLQGQINEAFAQALERLNGVAGSGTPLTLSIVEHLRAAYNQGLEDAANESARAKASSDIAILKAAVEEFNARRTQAEVLSALVERAASFAPRVAFFVVKGDQVKGWRARGFEGSVGDARVREISFPLTANNLLSAVIRSGRAWSGKPGAHEGDEALLARLGEEKPEWVAAVPLIARGKTVAVLYADSAALGSEAINLEALEMLARVASMAVELLAQRTTPTHASAQVAEQPARQAETPAEREDKISPASAEASEKVEAPSPVAVEANGTAASVSPSAAQTGTLSGYTAPLASRRRSSAEIDLPIEVHGEEERRLHTDARRFARLLVSEIKLYNEQKVREGRERGDLYTRLREEIERSRQMYEKRVAPPVAARFDYFHHELVNTLAEGDPSKLGPNYPGATVPGQN